MFRNKTLLVHQPGGGLRKMFGQDKPDVYGRVSLGAEVVETSVASNSVEAAWTQWAEWLVEEVAGHVVEVNMWDR